MKSRRNKLFRDENGDIIGLPLYLLILIVVVGLSIAGIYYFYNSFSSKKIPSEVTVTPSSIPVGKATNVVISVIDVNKDPVPSAQITIEHCGVDTSTPHTTGSDGKSSFSISPTSAGCSVHVTATANGGSAETYITVTT